ncbi:DoxX family protein [Ruania albidiflava]|uniref:DoxX family protein n=1 Tax=Ruania albidiflava TaxID=366586 RepID=UPI0003B7A614|nr:DoxX family protein [Ruania albidiflava]
MKVLHVLGRAALGLPFIVLGYGSAKEPGGRVKAAEKLGLPRPDLVVRANGAAMVAGGAALAVGVLPRAAAVGLVASLVPTTLAGHPFWETDDPAQRNAQKIQFMKNVGLAGALLAYASRDGR